MKLVLKALKVVFSLGMIYVVGENFGRNIAELYLEMYKVEK